MTLSDEIRRLGKAGVPTATIAKRLNIKYQHARKVLLDAGMKRLTREQTLPDVSPAPVPPPKPTLTPELLLDRGFNRLAAWTLNDAGVLLLPEGIPREAGVYAFCNDAEALYVGVATMGLRKRLYFYARPGITQTTSIRIKGLLETALKEGSAISVLIAFPDDGEWNGLRLSGAVGLEAGLIADYAIRWNMRGA